MALPPLKVKIGADTKGLETGLARARRGLAGFSVAIASAAGAASGALVVMTGRALQNVDAQAKLARAVGGSTTGIQALGRAADRAGVQSSELAAAATRLNQRLGEVQATGKGADDTFKALGISANELSAMDVDVRFGAISDAMQRAGMSTQEMSYHLRQLGIRQSSVITLMQGGSAEIARSRQMVEEFGVAVSDIDAAAIERANDALQEVGRVFEGLANRMAVEVAPHLERFANRFTELARAGGPLRDALDRVVVAAGSLMDVMSNEEIIASFSAALSGLLGLAEGVANGVIFAAENIEFLTTAAAAAAIALAAMGGPITLIAAATGAALVGIATLRRRTDQQTKAADEAARAQAELNAALGVFADTGAPNAAKESIALAQNLVNEARAAYEAASAHRELAASRANEALESAENVGGAQGTRMRRNAGTLVARAKIAADEADAAAQRLTEANLRLDGVLRQIMSAPTGPAAGVTIGGGDDDDDDTSTTGLGGGGKVADEFADRLDALMVGLQTERETLELWYEESQETLALALEKRLLTEEEYMQARARLEEEYAERSKQIESMRQDSLFGQVTSGLNDILTAAGQGNQKIMRVQKAFAAGMAWIDTLQGAARELRKGTFGFATAAAVIARGIGFVSAINSVSASGSGVGGGSSAAGSGGGAAAAVPRQNVIIDLVGDTFSRNSVQELFEQLNSGLRSGYQIEGVLVR